MKKSTVLISTLFLLITLHFSCKKNNMPNSVELEPVSTDSIRILDSIRMAMAVADSINMIILEKVESQLGKYNVTCRLRTTDIVLDSTSNSGYSEVPIDSLFKDTLILDLLDGQLAYPHGTYYYTFIESTVFTSAKLLTYLAPSNFFLELNDNKIKYTFPEAPSMCKCFSAIHFENDSIYYRYSNGWSSFDILVECDGTKIN